MTVSKRIAIATCRGNTLAERADAPLVAALRAVGIEALRVAWDDPSANWTEFSGVLIRSTWDWHETPANFIRWVQSTAARTNVWNDAELVLWSLDKRSLIELESRGIPSIPTIALPSQDELDRFSSPWDDWILKPAFGATAYRTTRIQSRQDLEAWRSENAGFRGPLVAQQFQPSVLSEGELSLVFIDGGLSHTVRKRTKSGDFRVQAEFGGSTTLAECPREESHLATALLATLPARPVFCRVDVVRDAIGQPRTIECELAEPELFFDHKPEAAIALARAVRRRLLGES
ncbi:MAG: hypothetical protein KF691_05855 [Phycisphaeraceae bacterium]|nr:hypothetical protein [Phycisphaeraceae bacterium]